MTNATELRQHVETIEGLIAERVNAQDLIREAFAAAKSAGFDPKAMRIVIARRAAEREDLEAQDFMVQAYERELDG
jgi:uncharacterized protein (UPF0335 family)